ncbi:MAG TPA: hypothetical protein VK806_07800 [Bacteroidia bacterium]|jgi:hypothetical protein|nr:hypothetical protein [Bacteroidia bacterium]
MKTKLLIASVLLLSLSGCGTMITLGTVGHKSDCQLARSADAQPRRIDFNFFAGDIFFTAGLGLVVDFADGFIYKPCSKDEEKINERLAQGSYYTYNYRYRGYRYYRYRGNVNMRGAIWHGVRHGR